MRMLAAVAVGVGTGALVWWLGRRSSSLDRDGPLLPPGGRWAIFGDSIAEGIVPPLRQLTHDYAPEMASQSIQGATILNYQHLFVPEDPMVDVAVIVLGSNDSFLVDVLKKEGDAFRTMLEGVRTHAKHVVWVWPPMFHEDVTSPSGEVVKRMIFYSGASITGMIHVPMQPDKIHPTPAGYRLLAASIFDHLLHPSEKE